MLMPTVSRFCADLTGRGQKPSGDPIIKTSSYRDFCLTFDPSPKSASCFLAPFRAVGNVFRWTLEKIYIAKFPDETKAIFKAFSPSDRSNIVAFLKKKDEILLKVIEDHMAAFRDVWPSQKFGSAQAVLAFISSGYAECFLEQYTHFRKRAPNEDQHPKEIAQYIAHESAIAKMLPHADLHEAALPALNQALNSATGIGSHAEAAIDFIEKHHEYYN
jgi:hypothetical protein